MGEKKKKTPLTFDLILAIYTTFYFECLVSGVIFLQLLATLKPSVMTTPHVLESTLTSILTREEP